MGFFSSIERIKSGNQEGETATAAHSHQQNTPIPGEPQAKTPAKTAPRSQAPVKLSFLQTCPDCGSADFLYDKEVGFLCSTCNLGSKGQPVQATPPPHGTDQPETTPPDCDFSQPAPSRSAAPDDPPARPVARHLGETPGNFKAAWPWLQENLEGLLSSGWSRAELFRRGKHRYPVGSWGIAWHDAWNKSGLSVALDDRGQVIFSFEVHNKVVTQTARKRP